jgi:hypothetical protein
MQGMGAIILLQCNSIFAEMKKEISKGSARPEQLP